MAKTNIKHKYNQFTIDDLESVRKRWTDILNGASRFDYRSDSSGLEDVCNWLADFVERTDTVTESQLTDYLVYLFSLDGESNAPFPNTYEDTVNSFYKFIDKYPSEPSDYYQFTAYQLFESVMDVFKDWFIVEVHPEPTDLVDEFFAYLYHEDVTEHTLLCVDAPIRRQTDVKQIWTDLNYTEPKEVDLAESHSGVFEVTPMDYVAPEEKKDEEEEAPKDNKDWIVPDEETLAEYADRALDELTKKDVNDILAVIHKTYNNDDLIPIERVHIESYDDFIRLSDTIKDARDKIIHDQDERYKRMLRSVYDAIDRINTHPDPVKYLDDLIYNRYHSSCITAEYLISYLEENYAEYADLLNLDLYEDTLYSVIIQFENECPWLSELINKLRESWDNSSEINTIVNQYLKSIGVAPEDLEAEKEHLIDCLPTNEKNADSPKGYKLFKACMYAARGEGVNTTSDVEELELNDKFKYGDTYIRCHDKNVPPEVSETVASAAVNKSLSSKVGNIFGQIYRFKYDSVKGFTEAFDEALGEHAEEFHQYRQQKAEERKRKREMKAAGKYIESIEKRREESARNINRRQAGYENTAHFRDRGYRDSRYNSYRQERGFDFAPDIPKWIIVCAGLIVFGLLSWLVVGGAMGLLCLFGTLTGCYAIHAFRNNAENKMSIALCAVGMYVVGILLGVIL